MRKGTRMVVVAHHDNSANNPYNPDPTKEVVWGNRDRAPSRSRANTSFSAPYSQKCERDLGIMVVKPWSAALLLMYCASSSPSS